MFKNTLVINKAVWKLLENGEEQGRLTAVYFSKIKIVSSSVVQRTIDQTCLFSVHLKCKIVDLLNLLYRSPMVSQLMVNETVGRISDDQQSQKNLCLKPHFAGKHHGPSRRLTTIAFTPPRRQHVLMCFEHRHQQQVTD